VDAIYDREHRPGMNLPARNGYQGDSNKGMVFKFAYIVGTLQLWELGLKRLLSGLDGSGQPRLEPGGLILMNHLFSGGLVDGPGERFSTLFNFLRVFLGLGHFRGAAHGRYQPAVPEASLRGRFHPLGGGFVFRQESLLLCFIKLGNINR
jgi:hypothetical protein